MTELSPKKRFTFHADPDQQIRDKDNAKPALKPSFAEKPAPNLAPPGCIGIRRRSTNHQPDIDI